MFISFCVRGDRGASAAAFAGPLPAQLPVDGRSKSTPRAERNKTPASRKECPVFQGFFE
jgi:hypothetical protein